MWVVFTLICALSLATADALTKKALRDTDEYVVGWLRLLIAVPPLLAVLFFIEWPRLDRMFYVALAAGLPLEVLAFVLYIRALKVSPMSLSLPFLAVTPVFLVVVAFVILGERPSLQGVGGILLIAAGSYVLNLKHFKYGLLEPVKAVFRERGSVLMLSVAFIYSFTASLVKLGINHSSALFYGIVYFTVLPVLYAPLALPRIRRTSISRQDIIYISLAGILMAVMVLTHVLGVSLTKVAYMVAVKRTSLLVSVLYGCLLFREGRLGERSVGTLLMFLGSVTVVTAG
jgi:drug/metabolite transporter (DMT)-like permease